MAYKHTNNKGTDYFLNSQNVQLRGSGKNQIIYFFSKDIRSNALEELPQGFLVVENQKTGLPTLKRK